MSSSPSSSSSESSAPRSLSNFDPFAVHPFTNCAAVPSSCPPTNNYGRYPYPYGQSTSKPAPNVTLPSSGVYPTNLPKPNLFPQAPPKGTNIFISFRQETASPELEEILKSKTHTRSPLLSSPSPPTPLSTSPSRHPIPRK